MLIVEDHRDTGEMLSLFLTQHGYLVTLVETLAEGLEQLDQDWYAVLSDLSLGDESGLEIARRARTSGRQPRLVALSAFGAKSDVEATRQAGFDAHLVKPVDLDRLLLTVERADPCTRLGAAPASVAQGFSPASVRARAISAGLKSV